MTATRIYDAKKPVSEKIAIFSTVIYFIFPWMQFFKIIPVSLASLSGKLIWATLAILSGIFWVFASQKTETKKTFYRFLGAIFILVLGGIKLVQVIIMLCGKLLPIR
jgi:hypothetical protein